MRQRPLPGGPAPRRVVAGLVDAVACWARMPPGPASPPRRFVVIQICGCSHEVLQEAVARGRMPALARLLRRGTLGLHRIPVGLPTSTPAFQAGLMYGGPVDIPGFEFLDKRTGSLPVVPAPLGRRGGGGGPRAAGAGDRPGGPHLRLRLRGRCGRHRAHLRPPPPAPRLLGAGRLPGPGRAVPDPDLADREDVGLDPLGARWAGSVGRFGASAWGSASCRFARS